MAVRILRSVITMDTLSACELNLMRAKCQLSSLWILFEIIDPYSLNKQGIDVGEKYRTGVYSVNPEHLQRVRNYIAKRSDADKIVVEVLPLSNYVKSDDEHQDRLTLHPNDYCHIPKAILHKYKK